VPHASYKTIVEAPYAVVAELLTDKVEQPRKYVGTVLWSRIVERGDDHVLREMWQGPPASLLVRERIHEHPVPDGVEFVYEHVDGADYTGRFRNILTRVHGRDDRCALEYRMEWQPRPGGSYAIDDATAERMVRSSTLHLKELAEHPPEVPQWVRGWFAAVDSLDADALDPWLADDVVLRFGKESEVLGRANVVETNRTVFSHMKAMEHHYVDVYHDKGKVLVEAFVYYQVPSGEEYLLPFLTTMRRVDGKLTDIRVYGDISPLRHGWE
jgi:ketosteroid isomerase-like protein